MASAYKIASTVLDSEISSLKDLLDIVFVHKDDRSDYEDALNALVQTWEGDLQESASKGLQAVLELHYQVTYPDPVRYGRSVSECRHCVELDPELKGIWPCDTIECLEA